MIAKSVTTHVEAARLEGCDEADVEVIAAMARREAVKALAEWHEAG